MNYKKQQKEDKKYFNELMSEFSKEELVKMLIRDRKRKNKYIEEKKQLQIMAEDQGVKLVEAIAGIAVVKGQLEASEKQRKLLAELLTKWMDKAVTLAEEVDELKAEKKSVRALLKSEKAKRYKDLKRLRKKVREHAETIDKLKEERYR